MTQRLQRVYLTCAAAAMLSACSGSSDLSPVVAQEAAPSASTGQVGAGKNYKVSYYAAARFAEQAAFGPTPALIEELRSKGFEQWIDEQFTLPLKPMSTGPLEDFSVSQVPLDWWFYPHSEWMSKVLVASDQLRLRLVWSLSQFVVAVNGELAMVHWVNLLYRSAFGTYRDLLRDVTINPTMGVFLNNNQNRPKSAECPHCAPNENYARELMQLFTIGVLKLSEDGTPVRDAQGRYIETYTQRDVEELSRVLTGWTFNPDPPNRPSRNWANWAKPMVPSTWPPERDSGSKEVLGRVFPAGQTAYKDLDDAIDLLVSHPNAAPFVSIRLIQNLVKSDPSSAYIRRVAQVFRNNGAGVVGDLKAVTKAVLLDPEARRGDDPASRDRTDGKFREPFLHHIAFARGIGCQRNFKNPDGSTWAGDAGQPPFAPPSVFGFYSPTDRAPGSNLLAPEQKLVNSRELSQRISAPSNFRWTSPGVYTSNRYLAAGCNIAELSTALARSPRGFIDLVSLRYFRGSMPPTLRSYLEQLISEKSASGQDLDQLAVTMLGFALASPYYGVIK